MSARARFTLVTTLAAVSCATPEKFEPIEPPTSAHASKTYTVHLGPTWFQWRSQNLGLSVEEASARDAKIDELGPPDGFWDGHTSMEAAAIWAGICNDCHGGRRRVAAAAEIPAPAADWSSGAGYFFGRKRTRREIFNTIQNGGPPVAGKASDMPAWRGRISREVSWALAYFIEYESHGIEGAFPPGLYPERVSRPKPGDLPDN